MYNNRGGGGSFEILQVRISLCIKLFFLCVVLCQRDKMSFREAESGFVEHKKPDEETAVPALLNHSAFS